MMNMSAQHLPSVSKWTVVIKDPNTIYTSYQKDLSIEKFSLETVDVSLDKGVATVFFIGEQAGNMIKCGEIWQPVPGSVKVPAGEITVKIKGVTGGYQQDFNLKAGEEIEAEYVLRSDIKIGTCHINMEFVTIPSGCFQMGDSMSGYLSSPSTLHKVCLTEAFSMGQYEVTQGQWKKIMGSNPSKFKNCGDNCPVENVSWDDIQSFIKKLNQQGLYYCLPTEAEWEYACRGGSGHQYKYCGTDNAKRTSWYKDNSDDKTYLVGQKEENGYKLYDMNGNVSEWVQDWYDGKYYRNTQTNDPMVDSGQKHVVRGGSWDHYAGYFVFRSKYSPDNRNNRLGFRLVRQP